MPTDSIAPSEDVSSKVDIPPVEDLLNTAVEAVGGVERPGQITMVRAVQHAIESGDHLAVQAGTGTGKSLAYLIPSIRHAMTSKGAVVVSTDSEEIASVASRRRDGAYAQDRPGSDPADR